MGFGVAGVTGAPEDVVIHGETCLEVDPNYSSFHDPVDADLIVVALGQAYVMLEDLSAAQRAVDELDPGNGLDPFVPSSWEISGDEYSSYRQVLLAKLQALQRSLQN